MIRTACFIAALCVTATAAADVFKYVDEKGQVQYTDRPEKLPAELIMRGTSSRREIVEIDMREGAEEAEGDSAVDRDKARQQAEKAKATQRKDSAANAEGKAEACNKARQDYLTRMNSQRLYEELPNGERRYLTDEELDRSRSTAQQAMDALCN